MTFCLFAIMNDVSVTVCQLMSKGIFALFGSHTANTVNTIKSFSSTFHMPYVTTSVAVNTPHQELGYELYLRPYYIHAIVDLLKHYNWTEVWYIYNSNEG